MADLGGQAGGGEKCHNNLSRSLAVREVVGDSEDEQGWAAGMSLGVSVCVSECGKVSWVEASRVHSKGQAELPG